MVRLFLLFVLLPACAASRTRLSRCASRSIERNLVVCDDQAYAQVDCLGGADSACRAVRVRTLQPASTVIHCAPGFTLDQPADPANLASLKFRLALSPDQTQIWFSGGDWLGRSWQAFSPGASSIAALDGSGKWPSRELRPADVAPLCGPARK